MSKNTTGLDHTKPCTYCESPVHTAPGVDNHVKLRHYTLTDIIDLVYCDTECLRNDLLNND